MQCHSCDHDLIDKARFCDDCGNSAAIIELDEKGLMTYCGKCLGRLGGTKKYYGYCGEPSPHSGKKKLRDASWIEQVLADPRVQMAICGVLLVLAALPLVSPIRYRTTDSIPFVAVVWEEKESPAVVTQRPDFFTIEPLIVCCS